MDDEDATIQRGYAALAAWLVRGNRVIELARSPEPPARLEAPARVAGPSGD